jgi:hypothetical protein
LVVLVEPFTLEIRILIIGFAIIALIAFKEIVQFSNAARLLRGSTLESRIKSAPHLPMAQGKFISYLRVSTDRQGRSGLGLNAHGHAALAHQ